MLFEQPPVGELVAMTSETSLLVGAAFGKTGFDKLYLLPC
jgi:hypothetical protein